MFELAAAGRPVAQCLGGNVHHDLMTISARRLQDFVCHKASAIREEGIRAAGAERHSLW